MNTSGSWEGFKTKLRTVHPTNYENLSPKFTDVSDVPNEDDDL